MVLEVFTVGWCLFLGFWTGYTWSRHKSTKAGTPSASHNKTQPEISPRVHESEQVCPHCKKVVCVWQFEYRAKQQADA
jgi:hypothetical protein